MAFYDYLARDPKSEEEFWAIIEETFVLFLNAAKPGGNGRNGRTASLFRRLGGCSAPAHPIGVIGSICLR
jgi:hypothetical protein